MSKPTHRLDYQRWKCNVSLWSVSAWHDENSTTIISFAVRTLPLLYSDHHYAVCNPYNLLHIL